MGNEAQRNRIYNAAKETWGEDVAEAVMEVLPPWDHAEVVRKVDLENLRLALEAKMDAQFARLIMFIVPMMFALVFAAAKLA